MWPFVFTLFILVLLFVISHLFVFCLCSTSHAGLNSMPLNLFYMQIGFVIYNARLRYGLIVPITSLVYTSFQFPLFFCSEHIARRTKNTGRSSDFYNCLHFADAVCCCCYCFHFERWIKFHQWYANFFLFQLLLFLSLPPFDSYLWQNPLKNVCSYLSLVSVRFVCSLIECYAMEKEKKSVKCSWERSNALSA